MQNFNQQYEDVMRIEGVDGYETSDEFEYYAAIQRQINAGSWSLQGSHGRTMMQAIEDGKCLLGKMLARDYWGNAIPACDMVKEGTKGSRGFVEANNGAEWADAMEAL